MAGWIEGIDGIHLRMDAIQAFDVEEDGGLGEWRVSAVGNGVRSLLFCFSGASGHTREDVDRFLNWLKGKIHTMSAADYAGTLEIKGFDPIEFGKCFL